MGPSAALFRLKLDKFQRVILSGARPRFRIGYASRFCGKPQKFDKLRMTRAGAVETRRATAYAVGSRGE